MTTNYETEEALITEERHEAERLYQSRMRQIQEARAIIGKTLAGEPCPCDSAACGSWGDE